jgi:hypothetical protein
VPYNHWAITAAYNSLVIASSEIRAGLTSLLEILGEVTAKHGGAGATFEGDNRDDTTRALLVVRWCAHVRSVGPAIPYVTTAKLTAGREGTSVRAQSFMNYGELTATTDRSRARALLKRYVPFCTQPLQNCLHETDVAARFRVQYGTQEPTLRRRRSLRRPPSARRTRRSRHEV